jgi:hypothetical protein
MVEIVGAYVEGLPIPNSSKDLIKLASEYLAGGWVKCWSVLMFCKATDSPSANSSNTDISSSSVFRFISCPTANQPKNFMIEPEALKRYWLSELIVRLV